MTLALRLGVTLLLGTRIDVTRFARLALARRTRNLRAVERQHVDLAAEHALDRPQAITLVIRYQ
jgi:hypothetical protein